MNKVLLLFGGNSSEHEVSCSSIINIIDNIDTYLFNYKIVGITKENKWIECKYEDIINKSWYNLDEIDNIIKYLKDFDVVFPIMHGKGGEDGKLQGMLDLFNIKYVGCRTEASVVGMDKDLSKIFFNSIDIPQVPYLKYDNNIEDIINLGFPLIVKPCNGGSSIGINKVSNIEELDNAIKEAEIYDKNIIVEKFIKSREFECAILEDDDIIVSNVGEIKYNHDFYDYEDKYKNKVDLIIPANIDDNLRNSIRNYSKDVFTKLGCKGLCRVDFLYDTENDKLYLNEINTLPGFTNISMYPMLMKDTGYSYLDLITILINNAK
ncbi:MAG: D-alanine--D-alanine ligase [Bacilli bacterium]|nr:D-alanine--D-alanine ligase [Bacilli bacterium]